MYVKAHELRPAGDERRISITTVMYHPGQGKVFLGTTDAKNDLLYTFDPGSQTFRSCDFARISDSYDVKIHRSLVIDTDGSILGATAGLHGVTEREKAKGGKIFRYRPSDGSLELVAEPIDRDYIQSILLDADRRIVYGFTYPVGHFFRYDLQTGATRNFLISSYPHLAALDDAGCVWGTYESQNRFFKYDPDSDQMHWLKNGLPRLRVSHAECPSSGDSGQVDCMLNGADGYLYIGSVSGGLYRMDPSKESIEYLGKPLADWRMSCLIVGQDGLIYGVGGMKEQTKAYSYDRSTGAFQIKGPVHDPERQTHPYITHHICMKDAKTFFAGETDNPDRNGLLWEIRLG